MTPPVASLPESEGAIRNSKKGASSQENPRGGTCMLTIVLNYVQM